MGILGFTFAYILIGIGIAAYLKAHPPYTETLSSKQKKHPTTRFTGNTKVAAPFASDVP